MTSAIKRQPLDARSRLSWNFSGLKKTKTWRPPIKGRKSSVIFKNMNSWTLRMVLGKIARSVRERHRSFTFVMADRRSPSNNAFMRTPATVAWLRSFYGTAPHNAGR
jgi:hypothetical protein